MLVGVHDVLCDGIVVHLVHVVADDEKKIEAGHDGPRELEVRFDGLRLIVPERVTLKFSVSYGVRSQCVTFHFSVLM